MQALTDQMLRSTPKPGRGRIEVTDARCQGLAFRVTDQDARTFSFRFRCPTSGRVQRFTIGDYPDISLANARKKADELRVQVANGVNPVEERKRERETRASRAFGVVAARYIEEHAKKNKAPSSVAQDERCLEKHILPHWRHKNITALRRADGVDLIQGIVKAGTPVQANRVQALISKIFSFSVDVGLRETNPFLRLAKQGGKEKPAKRYLSDLEIPEFWTRSLLPPMRPSTGCALRLILLTGVRANEAAGLCRDELFNLDDPEGAYWEIPGERTKNRMTHIVPLSNEARVTVLEALGAIKKDQQYLFASPVKKGLPIQAHSLTVAMQRMAKNIQGEAAKTWSADPPSPHDLRRTFRTKLSALGVPKDIRDRLMNHKPRDVGERHYDQYDFLLEKRQALISWAEHLVVLTSKKQ
jgi:integrase